MTAVLVASLLLAEAAALSAPLTSERFAVVQVVRVARIEALRPICGASEVRACTHFVVGNDAFAQCVEREGTWTAVFTGHLTAFIYAQDVKWVPHEMKHVNDVRVTLDQGIMPIEASRHDSREACEAASRRTPDDIRAMVRTAAAASFKRLR